MEEQAEYQTKLKPVNFEIVAEFERQVAQFFGAPYGVAVDSCTHGIELCLRLTAAKGIVCPKRTYLSVPMLASKLGINLHWRDINWKDFYYLTPLVADAAVLWKRNSYLPGTFMNISFQFQKHLNIGRGGMILCDDEYSAKKLKKMSYDGRLPGIPWREQDITEIGYHYYMTPEQAELGLKKLPEAIAKAPRQWVIDDWKDLTEMFVFRNTL